MPKVIELFGLPGSGKSTVCDSLVDIMRGNGMKVATKSDYDAWKRNLPGYTRHYIRIRSLIYMARNYRPVLMYLSKTKPVTAINPIRLFCIWLRKEYFAYFERDSKSDIYIFDQWVLQELWSLLVFSAEYSSEFAEFTAKNFLKNSSVIYFSANAEVCAKRIAERTHGASRFESTDLERIETELYAGSVLAEALYGLITEKGITNLKIDSTKAIENSSRVIISWVSNGTN